MGIKKQLKKDNPNRHKVFKALRRGETHTIETRTSLTRNPVYPDKHPNDMTSEEWAEWKEKKKKPRRQEENGMILYKNEVRVPDYMTEFNDTKGNIILLNVSKRVMLRKPYINQEYNREITRFVNKMAQKLDAEASLKKELE
jgi:hypothetical protein